MPTELSLFLLTTLTSTIAGIAAMGGGILLVLALPYFLPVQAVIPMHGIAQLASNSSRLLFSFNAVVWRFVWKFIIGAVVGSLLMLNLLIEINLELVPLFIASYLLLSLWCAPVNRLLTHIENFYVIGALQASLGLIVGAPGPMTVNLLYKRLENKDQVIATASLLMGITNINKVMVYGIIGFHYLDYSSLIIACILGATLGSYLGTTLRNKIPNAVLMKVLKVLITLMALQTLVSYSYTAIFNQNL